MALLTSYIVLQLSLLQHTVNVPAGPSSSAGVQPMDVDVAVVGAGPAGLAAAAALHIAKPSLRIHVFEKTSMTARGAAVLVGVNGLKALEAIGGEILERLLAGATKLDGSGRLHMQTAYSSLERTVRSAEMSGRLNLPG